tara:strand:- start:3146 stop:3319 length:174 start_codon:yes stop_codon:yes gene_type:complete
MKYILGALTLGLFMSANLTAVIACSEKHSKAAHSSKMGGDKFTPAVTTKPILRKKKD